MCILLLVLIMKNNNSSDISLVKYNNVLIKSTVIFSMILQGEEKILTGNWKTLGNNTGNFVIWIYADTTKICTIFLENLNLT